MTNGRGAKRAIFQGILMNFPMKYPTSEHLTL